MKADKLRNYIIAPLTVAGFFALVSVITWSAGENILTIVNYIYIGLFASIGMLLYAKLPKNKKIRARRISMFAIGLLLFLAMGVMGRIDGQLEGFFFYGLVGITAGTVSHYLIAKIIGPIFLNRGWCGWGCWTIMILDLFPYKRSDGRLPEKFGWIRYLHFVFSLGLVLLLWFGFDYSISRQQWDINGMYWFLGGNFVYYAIGISLVILLKDNRAFCKYVCPVSVVLKASSRFSLLKIKGTSTLCDSCDACIKTCPMNIRIPDYILAGQRVLSTECVMCLTCINTCPTGALEASLGFDVGRRNRLQLRP
ncbi:MAG TPA: 4Fe-4S dicluster domain-containing protein [Bacteroidota bacterium]|nr:4Fe-4S dicluster domain-containing protein [Bacteroidota bacterium]